MKRILGIFITLILLVTLISCTGYLDKEDYISNDSYENKLIETSKEIKKTTVSFEEDGNLITSGVVIKREKKPGTYKYYALTINHAISGKNNLSIYINRTENNIKYDLIFGATDYDVAVVSFESTHKLNEAKVLENNKVKSTYQGQSILTIGTDSRKEYHDAVKLGYITSNNQPFNDLDNYIFTHDAGINYGEKGSPIYDLDGYLVGINLYKTYHLTTMEYKENTLGLNEAIQIDAISGIFKKLDDFLHVDFDDKLNSETTNKTQLESKFNNLYNDINKSIVKVYESNMLYSGLIYEKENNGYNIITKGFSSNNNLLVVIDNKEYEVNDVSYLDDDKLISKLEIKTNDELNVYNDNILTNGNNDELTHSQYLVSMGYVFDKDSSFLKQFNIGSLSKEDYKENIFMHDLKLNGSQIGAPIFNLNGKLVGVHLEKTNSIETQTGTIAAEGLAYAFNLNSLNISKNINKYESGVEHEKKIINAIENVNDSVVTVRTESGHGSGVLFKKESIKKNKYRYYVLTNEHVLNGSSEIYIDFPFDLSIYAKDYQTSKLYDMAVVRFDSELELDIINSKVIDNKEGINHIVGQKVIAVGTPENKSNNNYVTTGIIKTKITHYDAIAQLAVHHDAPLNPGNSGGPLFDLEGSLIGLNVAKKTMYNTPDLNVFSERLSISLNINNLSEVFNTHFKILGYENVGPRKPRLGVSVVSIDDLIRQRDEAREQGLDNFYDLNEEFIPKSQKGVLITEVDKSYGAFNKLFEFDVIVEINGKVVINNDDVASELISAEFGDTYKIKVLRIVDGEEVYVEEIIEMI